MNQPRRSRARRGWLKRGAIVTGAVLVIAAGLLVGGLRLLDHFAPQYRNALIERIGQRIDAHITVDGLSLGWGWHGPVLYLEQVRITHDGQKQAALTARRLGFEFSLTRLLSGQRLPDGIIMDGPTAHVAVADGRLHLRHWPQGRTSWLTRQRLHALRRALRHITVHDATLGVQAAGLPGGTARWHNVDLALRDIDDRHLQADLSARGPDWLPRLQARARLDGPLDPTARARLDLRVNGLDPLALSTERRPGPSVDHSGLTGGTARLVLHARWQHRRLRDSRLAVDADAIQRAGADRPLVPAFQAVFALQSDENAHHITARLDSLSGGPAGSDALQLVARAATRTPALHVQADHLPGALALRIARRAVPRLADTQVSGDISQIALDWQPDTPLALALVFTDLKLTDPAVSFGPISGRYTQAGAHHAVVFNGAQGALRAPHYLHGALTLSDLRGRLAWQPHAHGGTDIRLSDLALKSREARLDVSGQIHKPAQGAPTVDLAADLSAPDIARLLDRIPQAPDLPNPRLRDWLPQAITAGTLDSGHAEIHGALDRFPFPNARGDEGFHVTLAGHGLDVNYKPGWPALHDARGQLVLDGDSLDLAIDKAKILDVGIDQAHAHVPNVREPVLALTGRINQAPSDRMLAFLTHSPLDDKFGALVRALQVSGPAALDVSLSLPLKPGLGDPKVNGTVTANGDTLREAHLPGPLTDIHGPLHFNGDGLNAHGLKARLLGVPLSTDLLPAPGNRQRIVARAVPELPADRQALSHYLPQVWLGYGHGRLPLRLDFTLGGHGRISPIEIRSNLAGLAVDLPAPMTKAADATVPLAVTVDATAGRIRARYGADTQLNLQLGPNGTPRRMIVTLGDRPVTAPEGNGLWIGGHADTVDAKGWFDVIRHVLYDAPGPNPAADDKTAGTPGTDHSDSTLAFIGGDVTIDRLNLGDRYIAGPQVRAQPMQSALGWRVDFEGQNSQGQITWTLPDHGPTRLAGSLKRVAIQTEPLPEHEAEAPAADAATSSILWPDLAPQDLPALSLFVQNFEVDDTDFGALQVDAGADDHGWHLQRFALSGGALTGDISADWEQVGALTSARAQAHLHGQGLSRLLRTAGYVSPVMAKSARIDADLHIAPNVAGLELLHLGGDVHLALDDGSLLTVNPGAGRLLGLFNLYVLPRRLLLNFRDVVDKGLAFDKIQADFDIRQGQAYSDNAQIHTPSSNIGISGRIGLATRDYDERVRIQPKLGSGVALASAVIGGPVVGAAVFAVQEILKKPIEHFSSISYRLQGSWDDPQIIDPTAEGTDDDTHADHPGAPSAPAPAADHAQTH